MKIQKILSEKEAAGRFVTVTPAMSLKRAAETLVANSTGALLVSRPESPPPAADGVITKTDIIRAFTEGRALEAVTVGDVMTKDLIVATDQDDVEYVLRVMTRHKITHAPVISGGKVAGILSVVDVLMSLFQETELRERRLSDFFGGTYGSDVF